MKKTILEAFRELGFEMEQIEDSDHYKFEFEGHNYIWMYNEDDESFLNIVLPSLLPITEEGAIGFYQLMDNVNSTVKYVKAYKFCDGLWLFYERELMGEEDLEKSINHMIYRLEATANYIKDLIESLEDSDDDDDNCDMIIDDIEDLDDAEEVEATESDSPTEE